MFIHKRLLYLGTEWHIIIRKKSERITREMEPSKNNRRFVRKRELGVLVLFCELVLIIEFLYGCHCTKVMGVGGKSDTLETRLYMAGGCGAVTLHIQQLARSTYDIPGRGDTFWGLTTIMTIYV